MNVTTDPFRPRVVAVGSANMDLVGAAPSLPDCGEVDELYVATYPT